MLTSNSCAQRLGNKSVVIIHRNKVVEFNLDKLSGQQINNLKLYLSYQAGNLREEILAGMSIWQVERAWVEWREINRQIDMITNHLACRNHHEI